MVPHPSRPADDSEDTAMNQRHQALPIWFVTVAFAVSFWSPPGLAADQRDPAAGKLKIVIFGGHPDDPESGAGGLIATMTGLGHEVIVAYGTSFRGDRQFFGRPEAEVRQSEASAA